MYTIICILIMIFVTYIPRALPICFIHKKIENVYVKSFLFYVPYAVLASLTFPFIFYFIDNIWIALIGTITAILLSLFNQKLIVVALVSVLVVYGLQFVL